MISPIKIRVSAFSCLLGLPIAAILGWSSPSQAQPEEVFPTNTLENADDLRPLNQPSSIFSLAAGERLLAEAGDAISVQDYSLAANKLREARQVFDQLSNFYQELSSMFIGIDSRITDNHRRRALQSAQKRDQASYQLALVHRQQNKPELAVPLLIQILRSQQPTRELGQQAYQQLFELGFVEIPYPNDGAAPSTSSSTPR
ncbi:MAG: hypothetical protein QNJ46_15785 [Leptolyngbyaceae cyanobacterium MO_188.B28]|nr:hypothetical protein [Leptolyngbyaceae cyanobacterium MO_188.B28]